jgi:rsbT co-antagonist protein RsbR
MELRAHEQEKTELIERLRSAIMELSVPVLEVWEKVLMVTLVGVFDSRRAGEFMEKIGEAIASKRARFVIVDISGVDVIDTQTADVWIKFAESAHLLGASFILTGMRPTVATQIAYLGIHLSNLKSYASLQDALRECILLTSIIRL